MRLIVVVTAMATLIETAIAQDTSWHLLSTSYGGTVSLVKNLTRSECDFMRARLLGMPATVEEEEEEAERRAYIESHPVCPKDKATKEEWEDWQKHHMSAQGCVSADGNGSTSWGGGRMLNNSDIKSAECFQ